MALYLINSPAGFAVIRAANGARAMQIAGVDEADVTIMPVEGEEGVVVFFDHDGESEKPPREVELTCLGDKERTFRNLDTGAIRHSPLTAKAAS